MTVAIITGAGLLLMETGEDSLTRSGPVVSVSVQPVSANNDLCCQRVRITHESGESLELDRIDLVVRLPDHDKQARLRDLPTSVLDQGDYTGNHVFTLGDVGIGGVADAENDVDGRFDAGDVIEFRIAHQRVDLRPGQHVVVSIRDEDTDREFATVNATVVAG